MTKIKWMRYAPQQIRAALNGYTLVVEAEGYGSFKIRGWRASLEGKGDVIHIGSQPTQAAAKQLAINAALAR